MALATFTAKKMPWGLRLAGELDLTTAPAFAHVLRARAVGHPRMCVDFGAITFADVCGLRTIFEVATELAPDSELVLCRPSPHLRRMLGLLRWQDPRVRIGSQ